MSLLDTFRLDGKVVLITGGGGGLGRAMAKAFAEVGADVAVSGRTAETLRDTCAEVEAAGRQALPLVMDLASPETPQALVDETIARFGKLDVLVNNAGGLGGVDDKPLPTEELSYESWDAGIFLNLTSAWRVSKAAASRLSDGGSILNMSSFRGYQPHGGSPAYGAAKAGLNNLTISLAREYAPRIRVNGLAPGPVPTETFKNAWIKSEEDYARVLATWNMPLNRLGEPNDVAAAALFLVTPASAWITGQTLVVSGGL